MTRRYFAVTLVAVIISVAVAGTLLFGNASLSDAELKVARSLSLASLPKIPPDPSNVVADNADAVQLGALLFDDTGMSANGLVSCATCHLENRQFQDDLQFSRGIGTTDRRSMPLRGVGYQTWFFWDGRKDSLWSQAIGPLENAVEHGFTRSQVAKHVLATYPDQYTRLFGPAPKLAEIPPASPLGNQMQQANWQQLSEPTRDEINRIFVNTGKSIAAFERTLVPLENRFDRYINAVSSGQEPGEDATLSKQEINGFKVFAGKGSCIDCHSGARLTDDFFHNTGVPDPNNPPSDRGRATAFAELDADPFTCLGRYSDAAPDSCLDLQFMAREVDLFDRTFKSPGLRGIAERPPFMHAGQIETLEQVIEHYNNAPPAPLGHSEIVPLGLSNREKADLLAFLRTL